MSMIAKMMGQTTTNQTIDEDVVVQVPIENIEFDRSWNCRKFIGDDDEEGPEEHSFLELVSSLKRDGQDTPVELKKGSDEHYFLIAGFRRFAAFRRIYDAGDVVKGVKPGHIKAFIRDNMSELDALVKNGRENTGRANLNMADTAFLIQRLSRHGMSDADIAERLAISRPWVSQLFTVYKETINLRISLAGKDVTVFDHWREAPGRVPFQALLDLARSPAEPATKEKQYLALLLAPKKKTGGRPPKMLPRDDTKTAEKFGIMLGRLVQKGHITVNTSNWRALLEDSRRVSLKDETEAQIEKVTSAARKGFERLR